MIEERKKIEIDHYNKKGGELLNSKDKNIGSEGLDLFEMSSYKFLLKYLRDKCKNRDLLDYGCGSGVHSFWLAELGARVTAIDLSDKLLEVAKREKEEAHKDCSVQFFLMDCEKLEFKDNSFDIIFDGGSFSSLDLNKALPGMVRVLRPNGFLIGIETFGYNPFANFKRQINRIVGRRTGWAASHIFRNDDIKKADAFFEKKQMFYFHLISWVAFLLLKIPGGAYLLKILEVFDRIFLKVPFLRKYSFKVVFIFSKPKK